MSPSGLPNHTDQSSSSAGRPVSIALPATSPLVASNANGHTQAVESKTLARNVKIRTSIVKPSVRFSTPPSKSVITAQAYNTAKRTARIAKKDRIANEILESERVYVGILSDVQEVSQARDHPRTRTMLIACIVAAALLESTTGFDKITRPGKPACTLCKSHQRDLFEFCRYSQSRQGDPQTTRRKRHFPSCGYLTQSTIQFPSFRVF